MQKKFKTRPEIHKELLTICAHADIVERAYSVGISQNKLVEMGEELVDWVLLFNKHRMLSRDSSQKWQINSVKDIEDCFWSPEFGVKGKVDCSVEVRTESGETMVI